MRQLFTKKVIELKNNLPKFLECLGKYVSHYRTNHVLFTMGTDFAFQYAEPTYSYIDDIVKMVKESKDGAKYKFVYSTAKEYL